MSTIDYSPKQHSYQVIDRDETILATFPAGPDGRTEAQRFALNLDHPKVALALQQFEQSSRRNLRKLGGRPLKAAQLAAAGAVTPNGGPGRYYVSSDRAPGARYAVNPPYCSCPDWDYGRQGLTGAAPIVDGHPLCKHLIAARLAGFQPLRSRPTWTKSDHVCDIFPVNPMEFAAMRQLWPDAYGPDAQEMATYRAHPTACCNTGHVGQMRRDGRFNFGEMYCWHCRRYLGEY